MIIDNIKSNRLKIDNCSKRMQFAVFVHNNIFQPYQFFKFHSRRVDNASTDFFVPNLSLNFYLKHFLKVNLDKFS